MSDLFRIDFCGPVEAPQIAQAIADFREGHTDYERGTCQSCIG